MGSETCALAEEAYRIHRGVLELTEESQEPQLQSQKPLEKTLRLNADLVKAVNWVVFRTVEQVPGKVQS